MDELMKGYVSAREQMEFQREMSNTAHVREVADLKAAGLNPVLSAHTSGASTPNGASDDLSSVLSALQMSVANTGKALSGSGSGGSGIASVGEYPQWISEWPTNGNFRLFGMQIPNSVIQYTLKRLYDADAFDASTWQSIYASLTGSNQKAQKTAWDKIQEAFDAKVPKAIGKAASLTGKGIKTASKNAKRRSRWDSVVEQFTNGYGSSYY